MSTTQVKSNLAKLLATENLTVEHRKVATASFNVETRVLYLPIWDEISNNVYDLLVGHEVGHAVYTPREFNSDNTGVPQSFLNVVEDARIERKMKLKYPGLVKSFYSGYKELNSRDFFEISDIDLEEMNFIDRINLYFKIGLHDVSTIIPFLNDEEKKIVKMVSSTETFENVIEVCNYIVDYLKSQEEETGKDKEQSSLPNETDQSSSGDLTSVQSTPDESEDSYEIEDDKPQSISGGSDGQYEEDEDEDDNENLENDELESKTDEAWGRNQRQLISSECKEHVYLSIPSIDWSKYIEPVDVFSENIDEMISEVCKLQYDNSMYGQKVVEEWKSSFTQFKVDSKKAVSYLVKEFEMKKKASEYRRVTINKTGVVNTNKLFAYKWTDDIFKKKTIVPGGKNHGLIMYIDWSGSMHENIEGAVKQLMNLISFCRKVSIPCQVFAFTDSGDFDHHDSWSDLSINNEITIPSRFKLVELFNSKIKRSEFDNHLFRIWALMKSLIRRFGLCPYSLGSTPLNESILAAPYIFKKFKQQHNVEKVNTVFLTDGESNHIAFGVNVIHKDDPDRNYVRHRSLAYNHYDSVICLKDSKTGYTDINISKNSNWNTRGYDMTAALLRYYKWVTRSNVIGFRLSTNNDLKYIIRAVNNPLNSYRRDWKNNKYFILDSLGYDEMYVLESSGDFNGEKAVINATSSDTKNKIRNQFRKYMKTKMFNKIILSKFVDQVA